MMEELTARDWDRLPPPPALEESLMRPLTAAPAEAAPVIAAPAKPRLFGRANRNRS